MAADLSNPLTATDTLAQVEKTTWELFPNGTGGMDQAEILRAVFLHLKQNLAARR